MPRERKLFSGHDRYGTLNGTYKDVLEYMAGCILVHTWLYFSTSSCVLQYIKACILFSLVRRVIIGDGCAGILSGGYPDRLEACDPTDRPGTILKKDNSESGKSGPGRNGSVDF